MKTVETVKPIRGIFAAAATRFSLLVRSASKASLTRTYIVSAAFPSEATGNTSTSPQMAFDRK